MQAEGRRYSAAKSEAEHSGNLEKSLPAFWHQMLILLPGTAEIFFPSSAFGAHPGEARQQTYS